MGIRARSAAVCALAAVALLAGCDGDDGGAPPQPSPPQPEPTTTAGTPSDLVSPDARSRIAAVYLLRDGKVSPVGRPVTFSRGVAAAALRELFKGPGAAEQADGYSTAVPEGTELLGIDLREGLAIIDLSREFGSRGGGASMRERAAQVVHTVTRFATIERVALRLEGQPVSAIDGSGAVIDEPVDRLDFEDQAPAILVESPLPRERVRSPLRVTGTSNTFEATSILELLGPGGERIRRRVVTATSGSGTRGTWEARLRFDVPAGTELELYTYESSAEDGRPLHEVRIPLVVR